MTPSILSHTFIHTLGARCQLGRTHVTWHVIACRVAKYQKQRTRDVRTSVAWRDETTAYGITQLAAVQHVPAPDWASHVVRTGNGWIGLACSVRRRTFPKRWAGFGGFPREGGDGKRRVAVRSLRVQFPHVFLELSTTPSARVSSLAHAGEQ
jgi:hypothetical protein